jgi:hypothetical protein
VTPLAGRWLFVLIGWSFVAHAPSLVAAQSLDIAGPYGNADGCKFAKDGILDDDELLLLKPDGLESYATACEFVQVLPAKDGTKVVTGLCHSEGEEGVGVHSFAIRKSQKDREAFAVYDSDGSLWGELRPCP